MTLSSAVIESILQAVYESGEAIMEVQSRIGGVEASLKADNSPVTEADIAAHRIINKVLEPTGFPVLSEEGHHPDFANRKDWETLWVVDPLDGTKEFIKGRNEYTVNIGLVHQGIPIFGVVYAPALGWVYLGGSDIPAMKSNAPISYKDMLTQAMRMPGRHPDKLTVVASRSHMSKATEALLAGWEVAHGPIERVSMGSSLKICLVAEGRAHAYPRAAPTMEWDTAAGHAVATAAGCNVFRIDHLDGKITWSEPLAYNKENLLNPHFLICGADYLCGHA